MLLRYTILFILLCGSGIDALDTSSCRPEFNIVEFWHENMTWKEFLAVRNSLQREALSTYVDKIEQQKMAQKAGLAVPKTYLASREKVPFIDLIAQLPSYAIKMTHLSYSEGLILVKNGINMITGDPITPEEIQKRVFEAFDRKPRDVESWALHQVQPGFIIQEYIPNREEVKIQTIWGKALVGEWRGGERQAPTTPILGLYDRQGNKVRSSRQAPPWWSKALEAAELLAQGTDALRVDFLVKNNGELLLNELEIWPETFWAEMRPTLEKRLNAGYRKLSKSAGISRS